MFVIDQAYWTQGGLAKRACLGGTQVTVQPAVRPHGPGGESRMPPPPPDKITHTQGYPTKDKNSKEDFTKCIAQLFPCIQ